MPTPNEDRSRSMNKADVVGQAADANHEEQVASNRDSNSSFEDDSED